MHFIIGYKISGRADHMTVDAEDALAAALKAKSAQRDAVIMYVRPQNRRGDARHPSHERVEGLYQSGIVFG